MNESKWKKNTTLLSRKAESYAFHHSKERVLLHIFMDYLTTWIDHIIVNQDLRKKSDFSATVRYKG